MQKIIHKTDRIKNSPLYNTEQIDTVILKDSCYVLWMVKHNLIELPLDLLEQTQELADITLQSYLTDEYTEGM